jgi:hypothetical protein
MESVYAAEAEPEDMLLSNIDQYKS